MVPIPSWINSILRRKKETGEEGDRGRCFNCGFLCQMLLEDDLPTEFYSIDYRERNIGGGWTRWDERINKECTTVPWCFRSVPELADEVKAIMELTVAEKGDTEARPERTSEMFEKNRECEEWIEFVPGLDPVAHLGGKAMQDAERRAQAIARTQTRLAAAEVILALAAVITAVTLAITFAGGGDTIINNFVQPTPIVIQGTPASPAAADISLTPTPSLGSIPDTASPQPQSTP